MNIYKEVKYIKYQIKYINKDIKIQQDKYKSAENAAIIFKYELDNNIINCNEYNRLMRKIRVKLNEIKCDIYNMYIESINLYNKKLEYKKMIKCILILNSLSNNKRTAQKIE